MKYSEFKQQFKLEDVEFTRRVNSILHRNRLEITHKSRDILTIDFDNDAELTGFRDDVRRAKAGELLPE